MDGADPVRRTHDARLSDVRLSGAGDRAGRGGGGEDPLRRLTRDDCGPPGLDDVYGSELAELVREYAPGLIYETGMSALPVDFRQCRITSCSGGEGPGERRRSQEGKRVSAFVHVVDCREDERAAGWRGLLGRPRRQPLPPVLLLLPGERNASRASSAASAITMTTGSPSGCGSGPTATPTFARPPTTATTTSWGWTTGARTRGSALCATSRRRSALRAEGGWGPDTGWLFVSGGSHAGNAKGDLRRIGSWTTPSNVNLIPLEPIAAADEHAEFEFAVDPPWRKDVWWNPEAEGTN